MLVRLCGSTSCSAPLMVAHNKIRFSRYKAHFLYYIYNCLFICLFLCVSLVSTLSVLCPEYLHCLSFSLYLCLSYSPCVSLVFTLSLCLSYFSMCNLSYCTEVLQFSLMFYHVILVFLSYELFNLNPAIYSRK